MARNPNFVRKSKRYPEQSIYLEYFGSNFSQNGEINLIDGPNSYIVMLFLKTHIKATLGANWSKDKFDMTLL